MPFKSEAQRKRFLELVKAGKMAPEVYAKWQRETRGKLPERLHPKKEKGPSTRRPLRR